MIERNEKTYTGRQHGVPAAAAEGGFSLLELVAIVGILGLVAGLGWPSMAAWIERSRVRTASQEIATAIQLQRMRAVNENTTFSIAFDEANAQYTLFRGDPATGVPLEPMARTLPWTVAFADGQGGDPIDTPADELLFNADGTVNDRTPATDQIFVRNAQGDVFRIDLNRATGRLEIEHDTKAY